jgi:hypothetical protein
VVGLGDVVPDGLTYEQLAEEFERIGPAAREPVPGVRNPEAEADPGPV